MGHFKDIIIAMRLRLYYWELSFVFILVLLRTAYSQTASGQEKSFTVKQCIQDLDSLDFLIRTRHANPYWYHTEKEFDMLKNNIKSNWQRQASVGNDEFYTGLARMVAFIGDGHSQLLGRAALLGVYPFEIDRYDDGLYLVNVPANDKAFAGARILSIGDIPAGEVIKRFGTIVPHSNHNGFKLFSKFYFNLAGFMNGLHIAKGADGITLQVKLVNGKTSAISFKKMSSGGAAGVKMFSIDSLDNKPLPLYRQQKDKGFWFIYLPEKKVVYVKYNAVADIGNEKVDDFFKRVIEFVNGHDLDKFILDIRDNGGGNNFLNGSVIEQLVACDKINRYGKFYTITGHDTFSAAMSLSGDLYNRTNTIFAGEPVGDHPVHPGDARPFALSNSKVTVNISSLFWINTTAYDKRAQFIPGISAVNTFNDVLKKEDKVLDAVLNYRTDVPKPLSIDDSRFKPLVGHYAYNINKALTIGVKNNEAWIEVTGEYQSPLYIAGNGTFTTKTPGYFITIGPGVGPTLTTPEHGVQKLLKTEELSPLELIYQKRFNEAEKAYVTLKQANKNDYELKGNNLAMDVMLLVNQKKYGMAYQLAKINAQINPGSQMANNVFQRLKSAAP